MPNKQTQNLLQKFVNNQCTKEEMEQLIAYFRSAKDAESLPSVEELLNLLDTKPTMDIKTANRIYDEIIKLGKHQKRRRNPVWRYAAAAVVVGLLATGYFFKDNLLNKPQDTTPIIVNNNIKPGVEKATLTLEDGTNVTLEKGTSFQTPNATSNGEEIVYEAGEKPKAEIAYNTLTIPRGGQYVIKLADGTQVWLNSESQLKYPVSFTDGESRQVELVYGEAYFKVSPSTAHQGADFKVYHNQQEVEVLGTEFNIKAYKDETNIYTTLVEGKVAVSSLVESRDLTPGQQSNLNLNTNGLTVSKVDVYNEISWKEGVFSFDNKSLKEIMQVLSRWYDMKVVFMNKEAENQEFIGNLGKNQNILEILSSIKNFGIINNFEINDKTIILK